MNGMDRENVSRACRTAGFLVRDLQQIAESADALLADVALDLIEQAAQVERRINRIEAIGGRQCQE